MERTHEEWVRLLSLSFEAPPPPSEAPIDLVRWITRTEDLFAKTDGRWWWWDSRKRTWRPSHYGPP